MRSSRLPAVKTLADFDFSFQPSVKREQIDSLDELGFVERRENVVCLGPSGDCHGRERAQGLLRHPDRPDRLARGGPGRRTAEPASQTLTHPGAPGRRRDRLPPGHPERCHPLLPARQPALRARLDGAHLEPRLRAPGRDPARRGHGRRPAGPSPPPLPHRQHPRQQLPDATLRRTLQIDPPDGRLGHVSRALRRWRDPVMGAHQRLQARPAERAERPEPGGPQSVRQLGAKQLPFVSCRSRGKIPCPALPSPIALA